MILSDYMLWTHHCRFLEKLGQNRFGGIGKVGRVVSNCTDLIGVIDKIQKSKLSLSRKELHRRRYNINKKLPNIQNAFKKQKNLHGSQHNRCPRAGGQVGPV